MSKDSAQDKADLRKALINAFLALPETTEERGWLKDCVLAELDKAKAKLRSEKEMCDELGGRAVEYLFPNGVSFSEYERAIARFEHISKYLLDEHERAHDSGLVSHPDETLIQLMLERACDLVAFGEKRIADVEKRLADALESIRAAESLLADGAKSDEGELDLDWWYELEDSLEENREKVPKLEHELSVVRKVLPHAWDCLKQIASKTGTVSPLDGVAMRFVQANDRLGFQAYMSGQGVAVPSTASFAEVLEAVGLDRREPFNEMIYVIAGADNGAGSGEDLIFVSVSAEDPLVRVSPRDGSRRGVERRQLDDFVHPNGMVVADRESSPTFEEAFKEAAHVAREADLKAAVWHRDGHWIVMAPQGTKHPVRRAVEKWQATRRIGTGGADGSGQGAKTFDPSHWDIPF